MNVLKPFQSNISIQRYGCVVLCEANSHQKDQFWAAFHLFPHAVTELIARWKHRCVHCWWCWCLLLNVGLFWGDWQPDGSESCPWEDVDGKILQFIRVLSWHASRLQQLTYLQHQQEITRQFCCFALLCESCIFSYIVRIRMMMITMMVVVVVMLVVVMYGDDDIHCVPKKCTRFNVQ